MYRSLNSVIFFLGISRYKKKTVVTLVLLIQTRGSGADCKTNNKLLNVSVTSSFPVNAHAFPTALPPRKRVEIEPSLLLTRR